MLSNKFRQIYENGEVEEVTVEYAKPFQFLNLGVLAYIGASQALAQISVDDKIILGSGPIGFLLWRGIYWSKQVHYIYQSYILCIFYFIDYVSYILYIMYYELYYKSLYFMILMYIWNDVFYVQYFILCTI